MTRLKITAEIPENEKKKKKKNWTYTLKMFSTTPGICI
jgi:hypothetical protein